jgi:hypothetical protein
MTAAMLSLALLSPVPLTTGCKSTQLSQTGPYKGDTVLYNADRSINAGYKLAHDFVTWEYNNRNVLPLQVTQAADAVRANARKSLDAALAMRDAYANNPSKENASNLDVALNVLQSGLAEAGKIMASNTGTTTQ